MKIKSLFLAGAFLLGAVGASPGAGAIELGLSPNEVFGLWTNINKALISYARNISSDNTWLGHVVRLKAQKYTGKIPEDVLKSANIYNTELSELKFAAPPRKKFQLLEKELAFQSDDKKNQITPSLVYLHSGHLLVETVTAATKVSRGNEIIGPFFDIKEFSGKVPSDVFGMVQLARHRLKKILAYEKSQDNKVKFKPHE